MVFLLNFLRSSLNFAFMLEISKGKILKISKSFQTVALQQGQVFAFLNHGFIQSSWNSCLHPNFTPPPIPS